MCHWNENISMGKDQCVLKLPKFLVTFRHNKDTVCIDKCIQKNIESLWTKKIITFGCCCGHTKDPPSIVISPEYRKGDYQKIRTILAGVDDRKWILFQWQRNKLEEV